MGFRKILIFVVAVFLVCESSAAFTFGGCPPKNKVYNKTPVCYSDADCQKYGKICCPNEYNAKSCTDRAPFGKKYDNAQDGNKNKAFNGPGVFCDGVKCTPWEVCKPDPITKRLKCQRA